MVSLRRRRLLSLCSGKSFIMPVPSVETSTGNSTENARSVNAHSMSSFAASFSMGKTIAKVFPGSSNVSGSGSTKEHDSFSGLPIKRRKRHRRKVVNNQEPCLMRGVYFKNMKWQAAIKVDKKQIHLGTVGSQEEAARLYDRAAFMCGREPNFELSAAEKKELRKFEWEEFLAYTRRGINDKKHRRRLGAGFLKRTEPLSQDGETKRGNGNSASDEVGPDAGVDTQLG